MRYGGDGELMLHGFADSDWAGDTSARKRISRFCVNLGTGMISWFSRKQAAVAGNSTEAMYMTASSTSCEAIYLRKLIAEMTNQKLEPTVVCCDNQSCIRLIRIQCFTSLKHINIQHHFLRERVQKGAVILEYVPSDLQVADILTKAPSKGQF
jgi:hypothetical protein